MDTLEGKTAVVTGAASGIGRAMARRWATAGMNVVLADVEEPVLDEAVAEVAADCAEGRGAIGVRTDVTEVGDLERLLAASLEAFGQVNILCNNAGVGGSLRGTASELAEWRWVMDVNFWGVVHGHTVFLPHLLEHGDGHLVNTASMAGHFPGFGAYAASKWAVVGISEGLHHHLRDTGSTVGVSCLCPGWVDTNIAESARNRPEWAAPDALAEPPPEVEAMMAFVRESLASGRPPADVADLVHDAVVGDRFWVFTDDTMVQSLRPRFDAILGGTNPPPRAGL